MINDVRVCAVNDTYYNKTVLLHYPHHLRTQLIMAYVPYKIMRMLTKQKI